MKIENVPNLGQTSDGAPAVIDTDRVKGVVGTRVCGNLLNPTLQELHNAIVGMGLTPSSQNDQLLNVLKTIQGSVESLSKEVDGRVQSMQTESKTDLAGLQTSVQQFSISLTDLQNQLTTLSSTADSFNSNIAKQVSSTQSSLGSKLNDLSKKISDLSDTVTALQAQASYREVFLSKDQPNATQDFSSQGILIVNVADVSSSYSIGTQASGLSSGTSGQAVRAVVVLVGVTNATTVTMTYSGQSYTFSTVGMKTPKTVESQVIITSDGKLYSSDFK